MLPITRFNIVLIVAAVWIFSSCKTAQVPGLSVKMDWDTQLISLDIRNKPLSEVLDRLKVQEGISIQVVDFEEKQVSLNIKNQALDSAVAQLLGPNKQYLINSGKRELVLKGNTGTKRGKKIEPKEGLKPKYIVADSAKIRPVPSQLTNSKVKPEEVRLKESDGERNSKRMSAKLAASRDTVFKKKGKDFTQPREGNRYTRLRFIMEDGIIKIEKAIILAGDLIVPPVSISDYVYAVEVDGRVVVLGSFQDPLEMHSHYPDPEKEHELLRAKTGRFDITLPDSVINPDRLKSLTLQFYRVEGEIATPALDISKFDDIQKSLRRVSRVALSEQDFPIEDLSKN